MEFQSFMAFSPEEVSFIKLYFSSKKLILHNCLSISLFLLVILKTELRDKNAPRILYRKIRVE